MLRSILQRTARHHPTCFPSSIRCSGASKKPYYLTRCGGDLLAASQSIRSRSSSSRTHYIATESAGRISTSMKPLDRLKLYVAAASETLEAGSDLEADHPGFHDKKYRERRDALASFAREHQSCSTPIDFVEYKDEEIMCWSSIWKEMEPLWEKYACKEFLEGMDLLKKHCDYREDDIPQQQLISEFLKSRTDFIIKPVPGQLSSRAFLNGLAFRTFFCTPYVRHHSMPLYTPEPDLCHELLGHVPLLTCSEFCDFSQDIGIASLGASDEDIIKLARCYWFSVEFGLCKEGSEIKAFGAGLLSSFGELRHVLCNDDPNTKPSLETWDANTASITEHPLTTFQPLYFVANSVSTCLFKL